MYIISFLTFIRKTRMRNIYLNLHVVNKLLSRKLYIMQNFTTNVFATYCVLTDFIKNFNIIQLKSKIEVL